MQMRMGVIIIWREVTRVREINAPRAGRPTSLVWTVHCRLSVGVRSHRREMVSLGPRTRRIKKSPPLSGAVERHGTGFDAGDREPARSRRGELTVTYLPLAVEPGRALMMSVEPRGAVAADANSLRFNQVAVNPTTEEKGRRMWARRACRAGTFLRFSTSCIIRCISPMASASNSACLSSGSSASMCAHRLPGRVDHFVSLAACVAQVAHAALAARDLRRAPFPAPCGYGCCSERSR